MKLILLPNSSLILLKITIHVPYTRKKNLDSMWYNTNGYYEATKVKRAKIDNKIKSMTAPKTL